MLLVSIGHLALFLTLAMVIANILFPAFHVFGESQSFTLQGIDNSRNQWHLGRGSGFSQEYAKNINQCSTGPKHYPFPQIEAVNYIGSGKTLNSTLWLRSPFQQPTPSPVVLHETSLLPSSTRDKHHNYPQFPIKNHTIREISRKYAVIVHVDSAYDLGQSYQVALEWNSERHTWQRTTTVTVPSSIQGDDRVLQQENNYIRFYVPGENHIDLPLNLGLLSYPSQYSIIAFAEEVYQMDSVICKLIDYTDVIHIPPPNFSVTMLPSSANIVVGGNKTVNVQIKSGTSLQSNVSLSADQNPMLQATFKPNNVYLLPMVYRVHTYK